MAGFASLRLLLARLSPSILKLLWPAALARTMLLQLAWLVAVCPRRGAANLWAAAPAPAGAVLGRRCAAVEQDEPRKLRRLRPVSYADKRVRQKLVFQQIDVIAVIVVGRTILLSKILLCHIVSCVSFNPFPYPARCRDKSHESRNEVEIFHLTFTDTWGERPCVLSMLRPSRRSMSVGVKR